MQQWLGVLSAWCDEKMAIGQRMQDEAFNGCSDNPTGQKWTRCFNRASMPTVGSAEPQKHTPPKLDKLSHLLALG
eukprot:901403-Ditylum_brightwellii.AAC.1